MLDLGSHTINDKDQTVPSENYFYASIRVVSVDKKTIKI